MCSEELTLPKQRAGLCPQLLRRGDLLALECLASWECLCLPEHFGPCHSNTVIYDRGFGLHRTRCASGKDWR